MKRSEAWKPLRDHGAWMQTSEKVVFYVLLERADNGDCTVPDFMTPSLVQLAEMTGAAKSTVRAALNHLEHHAWVIRKRTGSKDTGKPGRGHKTEYQLREGFKCGPGCDYWRPSPRQRGPSPPTGKEGDELSQTPTSSPVSDEGLTKGEGREGEARAKSLPPDWTLIKHLIQRVHDNDCGGLHRLDLAEFLGVDPHSKPFSHALGIAYRNRKIDFCRQYVVKPITPKERSA